jgi:DNA-binding transcriptional ArsR family regulator
MPEPDIELIDMSVLEQVAPIIRNAAHPLRLRILDFLRQSDAPRNVTDIVAACEAEQAFVSQQLRILKDQGILVSKRTGSFVYYQVANRAIFHLIDCIRSQQRCG